MPDTVYRIVLTDGDGDATDVSFAQKDWWEWLHSPDPAIPQGQSSVKLDESNTPADLCALIRQGESWDFDHDDNDTDKTVVGSVTIGSYDNDKAQIISCAISNGPGRDTDPYEEALKSSAAGEMPAVEEYHGLWY